VSYGDKDNVAGESDVGVTGVVEEQHHGLVFLIGQGDEVEAFGDLDLGVLEVFQAAREATEYRRRDLP
jgi:hypothetical protein